MRTDVNEELKRMDGAERVCGKCQKDLESVYTVDMREVQVCDRERFRKMLFLRLNVT